MNQLIDQKYSLLVAEACDSRFNQIQSLLNSISAQITLQRAKTQAEIIYRLGQQHFDLLFLSHELHSESGLEVLRNLVGRGSPVPILYLIPKGESVGATEVLQSGAMEILFEGELSIDLLEHVLFSCRERWLRESNRQVELHKFRVMAQGAQEGIALTDGHNILETNESFAQLFGYSPHEIPGQPLSQFLELPKSAWVIDNANTDTDYNQVFGFNRGRESIALLYKRTGITYLGKSAFLLAIRMPRATDGPGGHRKANYFKALVDSSHDFICVFSPRGDVKYVTPAVKQILGYSVSEAFDANIWDLLEPTDSTRVLKDFAEGGWPQGQSRIFEIRVKHKDGDFHYLECIARNCIKDPAIRGLVVNCRDITLRRTAEEDLLHSRSRLEMISRISNDGIWDWDMRKDHLFWSPRLYEILKLDPTKPVTKWDELITLVHISDRESFQTAIKNHLEEEHAFICDVRLVKGDGKYGYYTIRGESVRDEMHKPVYMAGSITDITARKTAENLVRYESLYDHLTNLPKRELLYDRISMCLQRGQHNRFYQFAVLLIDLDRFTNIINSFGHQQADKLLVEFALRVKRCIGSDGTLSRLSGDEFGLLLEDCPVSKALRVSQVIQKSLSKAFKISQKDVFLSVSIGIAMNSPIYQNADEIMRDAGVAMNRAKKRGKGGAEVFNTVMHFGAVRRLQVEMDLRRALDNREFELYYQPIVSLKKEKVGSMECLIRWNHPQKGLIMPMDFIPVAEETGLILAIDEWVLQRALEQAMQWGKMGIDVPRLAINFSAKQFQQKDLAQSVEDALSHWNVKADNLEIEITETTLMEDNDANFETLKQLSQMGVHFSIDDFGTGYSSLGYLKRFPSHTLKIDGSFIHGLEKGKEDSAIVSAIIALAKNLGLHLVAEGVESPHQLSFLRDKECDEVQGFAIARPMPSVKVEEYLKKSLGGLFLP